MVFFFFFVVVVFSKGEIPKIVPPKFVAVPANSEDWTIKTVDRLKYEELFESLQPVDGLLPGNKVRSVLMDSKLPLDALSKIWDLADQDRDGSLDKHEFVVVSWHGRSAHPNISRSLNRSNFSC